MLKSRTIIFNIYIILGSVYSSFSYADSFFNPSLISSVEGEVADLSRFDKGQGQPEGTYSVEIYINNEYVSTKNILFYESEGASDDTGLLPCLKADDLTAFGVNLIHKKEDINNACIDLLSEIEKSSVRFDFERQKLFLSIPQIMFKNNIRGYIPPEKWDNGINAILLNYNFTGRNNKNDKDGSNNNNYFLNLTPGINIGSWRFRNESSWIYSRGQNDQNKWRNIRTYAQKPIISLKADLTVGDSFSNGSIFDSLGFRGAKLESDDNMLPDSMRGFAPTIKGIANSNAIVTVKQNGFVIYQISVPPGAFEIKDLYATSSSGNLDVTVEENNGKITQFVVPYSNVPILQREGRLKYELIAGEFRSGSGNQDKPNFGQFSLIYGLPYNTTLYGGSQFSNNYQSYAIGLGGNLGNLGAISADLIQANSILPNEEHKKGQSVRLLYAKSINEIGTNFQIMGYRYSTQGYYTLNEVSYKRMKGYEIRHPDGLFEGKDQLSDYHDLNYSKKGRFQINISQKITNNSSLYILGSYQNYWRTSETEQLWQIGYSGDIKRINYNLSLSKIKSPGMSEDNKNIAFNISIPIDDLFNSYKVNDLKSNKNSMYAVYSMNRSNDNVLIQQAGLTGTLLEDNNLNYNIQQGYAHNGGGYSGMVYGNYKGKYANVGTGYNYSNDWHELNYSLNGGIVAHSGGITLSQPLGDTNILIKANNANNIKVDNANGVLTNNQGYAILPYASTYKNNRVSLDVNSLGENVELENSILNVVPTKGALVQAEFKTNIGYRAMVTLTKQGGSAIPFGAIVVDEARSASGIVGDDGRVFISGLAPVGKLKAKWGQTEDKQCLFNYKIDETSSKEKGIYFISSTCQHYK
ncbi:fimbrial biogenesis usher protein [Proteus columbae]|uniref:fimbrial biogenesis usher protein n=1 Tax=Proteus columbae TaxID=1987580 RepID=UPI0018C79146|nr:fimbrial biogenesis usher protein [Proteus columbae]MBG6027411.1 fimbrial biogenesis usher protein [Proteus mirabilis]MBG6049154.1 fimbrial biogenesis usher protein [Proteus mirabilis]